MTRARASLAALALLAGCAPAGDTRPAAPAAAGGPPRIVSLNPCSDAILAEIAAPGQLVAISSYSRAPASSSMEPAVARRFAAVSGSAEEVAAMAPDLVVAGSFLPPATRAALHDLGMRVVTLRDPTDLATARAQVRELARLAGRPAQGEALVARIDRAAAAAAPPPRAPALPAIVWEGGGIVAGPNTLIADLARRAGFADGAALRGLGQADVLPLERVLADPPRVLFTIGSPVAQEDRMLRHPALARLAGTTTARLDPALLWCGGPTIPRALARLAQVREQGARLAQVRKEAAR